MLWTLQELVMPVSALTFHLIGCIIHFLLCSAKNATALLQDAYLDAVRKNIRSMECRVTQAELLIPQLQYRRQAHMEQTVNSMSSRVAFLNRRIDELMPPQWKAKMPMTIS